MLVLTVEVRAIGICATHLGYVYACAFCSFWFG
jgi:hypothetical protein